MPATMGGQNTSQGQAGMEERTEDGNIGNSTLAAPPPSCPAAAAAAAGGICEEMINWQLSDAHR